MIPEHQSSLNLVTIELIVDHRLGYSRKKTNREVEGILFWKPSEIFYFFYFTPGNSRQYKAPPLEILQSCIKFLENSKTKPPRSLEIQHHFFLVTLVNSFCYFFDTPGNYMSSTPPPTPFGFLLEYPIWRRSAGYLATYLLASCVVFYVLGSYQLSGGILVWWPVQCISRKISLDFSFWFLMRISRILYLAYEGVLLFHCLFFHKLFKESIVIQESRMIPMWFWDLVGITVLVRITVSLLEVRGEVCLHARVLLLRIA